MGDFALGKFNGTFDCFGIQPIGTLVDSMRGNPDVRATGNSVWRHVKNPYVISTQKCSFLQGIWTPHLIHSSSGLPESTSKWHLDQFSRFCRVHGHYKQTKRPHYSMCRNRQHLAVMRPNKMHSIKGQELIRR